MSVFDDERKRLAERIKHLDELIGMDKNLVVVTDRVAVLECIVSSALTSARGAASTLRGIPLQYVETLQYVEDVIEILERGLKK